MLTNPASGYWAFANVNTFSPTSLALISVPITPPVIPLGRIVTTRMIANTIVEIAQ